MDYIVLGAGGFARELIGHMLSASKKVKNRLRLLPNPYIGTWTTNQSPDQSIEVKYDQIFPATTLADIHFCHSVFMGVGSPSTKVTLLEQFPIALGKELDSLDFTDGTWDRELGKGSIICPGTRLTVDITIGNYVLINLNCVIGHDVVIEDLVTIAPSCNLMGGVKIGCGTELGAGVTVIPGVTIGKDCVIGAGAVVTKDIPDSSVAVGVPAKVIKTNDKPSVSERYRTMLQQSQQGKRNNKVSAKSKLS